ncbi:hypothetical protein RIF24_14090 [Exiguobacterium acetylicum]|uniref:hypothetical protein n=1 Tax=Exiguobacterium acetylicum TaxID=41170 RepID=UPI003977A7AF
MSSRIDTIEKLMIAKEWIIQKQDIIDKRHQLVINKNLLEKQLINQNNISIQEFQEKQQEEYREYENIFNERLNILNERKEELLNEKSELKKQFIHDQTLPYTKEIKKLEMEKKKKATLTNFLDSIKNNRNIPRFFYPISLKEWVKYLIVCSIVCMPLGYIFPNGFALPWLILTVVYPILRLGSWITKVFFLSKFDKDISKNQKHINDTTKRINENKLTNDVLDNVTQLIISLENKMTEQLSANKLLLEDLVTTHVSNYSSFNERLINQLNQKIETYLNENQEVEDNLNFELDKYNKLLEDSIVSARYQTLKSISAIIEPLRNQQADTVSEAIEFYLNEQEKEEERLARRRKQELDEEKIHQEILNQKEQLRIQEEESFNRIQLEREAINNEILLKEMEIDALLQQHQDNLQLEQERINKENEMLEIQLTQQSELEILNIQLAEQQLEIERQKQYYSDLLENRDFELSMKRINDIKETMKLINENSHLADHQKEKKLKALQDDLNKISLETQP